MSFEACCVDVDVYLVSNLSSYSQIYLSVMNIEIYGNYIKINFQKQQFSTNFSSNDSERAKYVMTPLSLPHKIFWKILKIFSFLYIGRYIILRWLSILITPLCSTNLCFIIYITNLPFVLLDRPSPVLSILEILLQKLNF